MNVCIVDEHIHDNYDLWNTLLYFTPMVTYSKALYIHATLRAKKTCVSPVSSRVICHRQRLFGLATPILCTFHSFASNVSSNMREVISFLHENIFISLFFRSSFRFLLLRSIACVTRNLLNS